VERESCPQLRRQRTASTVSDKALGTSCKSSGSYLRLHPAVCKIPTSGIEKSTVGCRDPIRTDRTLATRLRGHEQSRLVRSDSPPSFRESLAKLPATAPVALGGDQDPFVSRGRDLRGSWVRGVGACGHVGWMLNLRVAQPPHGARKFPTALTLAAREKDTRDR
jgi:hypothetical protein